MDSTETKGTALIAGVSAGIGTIYADRLFPGPAFSNLVKRAFNLFGFFKKSPTERSSLEKPMRKVAVLRIPDPRE